MTAISGAKLQHLLQQCDGAQTSDEKGTRFEDVVAYLFQKLPGIRLQTRDRVNAAGSEEIDLAFWNEKRSGSVDFLPNIVLVEVKNWTAPVDAAAITVFDQKVKRRGLSFGILVAAHGITGDLAAGKAGHDIVRGALLEQRQLVVMTRADIEPLRSSGQLIELIQYKMCELVVTSAIQ